MGYGYTMICNSDCGYQKELFLGIGMIESTIENCLRLINTYSRKKLLLKTKDIPVVNHEYGGVCLQCPTCGDIDSKDYVKFHFKDGTSYETTFRCGKCRTKMKEVEEENIMNSKCPNCKKGNLKNIGFIMWD